MRGPIREVAMRLSPWGMTPSTPRCTPDTGERRIPVMRRASALVIVPLLAAAAVVGCASSSSSSSAGSPAGSSAAVNQSVKVSGGFGVSPKVVIPKVTPGTDLFTKTLIKGAGPKLTSADSLIGNFVLYDWSGKTAKLVGSTFSSSGPTLVSGQMLPGLS